jgi:hypothetical protein
VVIVSGGQTGVDRAAWDVAIELGLPIGGWVPKGRRAEDGAIPESYIGLREAESADPAVRTALNVRDSDATVIFSHGPLTGGSRLTFETAARLKRPVLHVDLTNTSDGEAVGQVQAWLVAVRPNILNVAGPRASGDASIGAHAGAVLRQTLRLLQFSSGAGEVERSG